MTEKELEYQRNWRKNNIEKTREYCRKWRLKNVEKERQRIKQYMKDHPDYRRNWNRTHKDKVSLQYKKQYMKEEFRERRETKRLWDLYRITPEEQEKIRNFQLNDPEYSLVLGKNEGTDHCHKTGLIRGMMDWRINMAYGLLEAAARSNNVELYKLFKSLSKYAESPPAEIALGEKRYGLIGLAKYKKKMIYGSEQGPIHEETKSKAVQRKKESISKSPKDLSQRASKRTKA